MTLIHDNKYFIAIENNSFSPIQIDAWIKTRRNTEKTITPAFALEILQKTNNLANIKTVIKEIQKLPIEKQLEYKDFVLSAVSYRTQSKQIMDNLYQLALDGNYLDDFTEEQTNKKIYFPRSCKTKNIKTLYQIEKDLSNYDTLAAYDSFIGVSSCEIQKCTLPQFISFLNYREVKLTNNNYDNTKEIKFNDISKVTIAHQYTKIPEELDFSTCFNVTLFQCNLANLKTIKTDPLNTSTLKITGCQNLPQKLHFYCLTSLSIAASFNTTDELIIEDCNNVSLSSSTRIPKKITIRNSQNVNLDAIDFDINELTLENIEHISLCKRKLQRADSKENPPSVLDLSTCDDIIFQHFPLGKIKELKFGSSHKSIDLKYSKSMPEVLDLSGAQIVHLDYANCEGLKEIKFGKNSTISLTNAYNLPKKLDISMCGYVDMFSCDLSNIEEIILSNPEQKKNNLNDNPTFKGKIKYTTWENFFAQTNEFTI